MAEEVAAGALCPHDILETCRSSSLDSPPTILRPLLYSAAYHVNVVAIKEKQAVCKSYVLGKMTPVQRRQLELEVQLHAGTAHPNVVTFYLAATVGAERRLLMEYCAGGDLRGHLYRYLGAEQRLREEVVAPLCGVLAQLHARGVVHRDVKPENVFVDIAAGSVKLGDFGLAVRMDDVASERRAPVSDAGDANPCAHAGGTPAYTAPEVLEAVLRARSVADTISPQNDVWSLGVMVLEALTGCHPFAPCNVDGSVVCAVVYHRHLHVPAAVSAEARDWLACALRKDPVHRLTAQQLLSHPWLTQAPGCADGVCAVTSAAPLKFKPCFGVDVCVPQPSPAPFAAAVSLDALVSPGVESWEY